MPAFQELCFGQRLGMDHLPLKNPIPEFKVPYYDAPVWDGDEFWLWPKRLGWSFDFLSGEFHGRSLRDCEALIQGWLYFGFPEALIGVRADRELFVSEEVLEDFDNGSYHRLTSQCLPDIMREWAENVKKIEKERILDVAMNAYKGLYNFDVLVDRLSSMLLSKDGNRSLIVSLIILQNLMKSVAASIFHEQDLEWGETVVDITLNTKLYGHLLAERGWCPRVQDIALGQLATHALLYMLSCGKNEALRDHSDCNSELCEALQTKGNESIRHVQPGCPCKLVGPDEAEVNRIIENGGVPLIGLTKMPDGSVKLHVKAYEPELRYCCISHVWGDRFASIQTNEMTTCQLSRIVQTMASRTRHLNGDLRDYFYETSFSVGRYMYQYLMPEDFDETYIWIDSFCIPKGQRDEKLRHMAIRQMRWIYENATSVLALDAELVNLPTSGLDNREIVLRLFLSGWSQRLWTLQEGSFNSNVFIAVGPEAAYHMKALFLKVGRDSKGMNGHDSLGWELFLKAKLALQDPGSKYDNQVESVRVQSAIRAIRTRSTSRPHDETICIASFFDLDVAPLLEIEATEDDFAHERMRALLKMMPVIPDNILFANGPRLPFDSFRWAPTSLLSPWGVPIDNVYPEARGENRDGPEFATILTDDGLKAILPTLKLFVEYDTTADYSLLKVGTDALQVYNPKSGFLEGQQEMVLAASKNGSLYLILPHKDIEGLTHGVLVSKQGDESRAWKARYLSQVRLNTLMNFALDPVAAAPPSKGSKKFVIGRGERVNPTPTWCID